MKFETVPYSLSCGRSSHSSLRLPPPPSAVVMKGDLLQAYILYISQNFVYHNNFCTAFQIFWNDFLRFSKFDKLWMSDLIVASFKLYIPVWWFFCLLSLASLTLPPIGTIWSNVPMFLISLKTAEPLNDLSRSLSLTLFGFFGMSKTKLTCNKLGIFVRFKT